jgi:hypothetical protein
LTGAPAGVTTSTVASKIASANRGVAVVPQGKEVFAGLNQNGVILFVVLLLITGPCLCWLPWVLDGMKADKSL